MLESLKLVLPSLEYRESFLEAMDECESAGIDEWFWSASKSSRKTLQPYLKNVEDQSHGVNLKETQVPATMYWLVQGKEILGRVHIRHTLNDKLLKEGGHIGYYIKPSKWNQGYGTKALNLGLKQFEIIGVKKALVTTDDGNLASARVIEKCGGVLENRVKVEGRDLVRRYWIEL